MSKQITHCASEHIQKAQAAREIEQCTTGFTRMLRTMAGRIPLKAYWISWKYPRCFYFLNSVWGFQMEGAIDGCVKCMLS